MMEESEWQGMFRLLCEVYPQRQIKSKQIRDRKQHAQPEGKVRHLPFREYLSKFIACFLLRHFNRHTCKREKKELKAKKDSLIDALVQTDRALTFP